MAAVLGYRLEPQGHHLLHGHHVLCHHLEPGKLHVYLLLQVASYLVDLIGIYISMTGLKLLRNLLFLWVTLPLPSKLTKYLSWS